MQTHLKGFGLENFRVFKDYTWFDFAPITILTGPNSSGKSSLNKALMLMKDNFEKGHLPPKYFQIYNDENGHTTLIPSGIEFNGKVHGLNDPHTTKCRNSSSNIMKFIIPYDIVVYREEDNTPKSWETNTDTKREVEKIIEPKSNGLRHMSTQLSHVNSADELFYDIKYKSVNYHLCFDVDTKKALTTSQVEIRTMRDRCVLKITDHKVYFDVLEFNNLFESGDLKLPVWLKDTKKEIHSASNVSIITWLTKNGVQTDTANDLGKKILSQLDLTNGGSKKIKDYMASIDYLSTARNEQKRIYSDEDKSAFRGILETLETARKKGFDFEEYLSDCSKMFGIDGIFDFEYDSQKGIYFPNIGGQSFVNVGYGLNQIALIIFKIVEHGAEKYNNRKHILDTDPSILIIEEPESNLHPKFQSLLADLIVEAADALNIQFIIETHSEYLIRKLQFLTAKKEIKPEDSVIYYFHDPNDIPLINRSVRNSEISGSKQEKEKQVKKIQILEDGSLSDDFGPGFFDEAANWELELIRLKNNKNRNN